MWQTGRYWLTQWQTKPLQTTVSQRSKIASDFPIQICRALVVAVAAMSDQKKADQFANKYQIPTAYGSYLQLAKDSNVDIVYVGTMHQFHREACLTFLEHGKHVLCEKPLAMNVTEVEEILSKAKEKNLLFVEGMWSRFYPANIFMTEQLRSGSLGEIMCVRATFACPGNDEVLQPHGLTMTTGATLATGVYPVAYVQQVFKEMPEKITAVGQYSEQGGDVGACITLQYKGNKLGMVYYHCDLPAGGNSVTIQGTKGTLTVHDDMHTPTSVTSSLTGETRHFPLPDIKGPYNWWHSNGFAYEAQAMRQCLLQGLTESPIMPHSDSLTIMAILEEVCRQIGAKNDVPWI